MARNDYTIKSSKGEKAFDYVLLVLCLFLIVITVYPFLNVLAISLNDSMDTMRNVNFIIPRKFTLSNYTYIFKENDLGAAFMMSVVKTVVGTVIGVICTAMLAYVLSRKDFYFKKPFTILFIITMYVSGGLLPEYLLLTRTLNLGNNFWVYIIPGLIWVYNVILMRSFIEGLPIALQEAAKLDGANDFTIWLKVILPLCTPTIATVGTASWIPICTQENFRLCSMCCIRSWSRQPSRLTRIRLLSLRMRCRPCRCVWRSQLLPQYQSWWYTHSFRNTLLEV